MNGLNNTHSRWIFVPQASSKSRLDNSIHLWDTFSGIRYVVSWPTKLTARRVNEIELQISVDNLVYRGKEAYIFFTQLIKMVSRDNHHDEISIVSRLHGIERMMERAIL